MRLARVRRWRVGFVALLALAACTGPNHGKWAGTFEGSVSGVMKFEISVFGGRLSGTLEGSTAEGQPFSAKLQGRLRGQSFYAVLSGASQAGLLRIPFEGLMKGDLADGKGGGDWTAQLKPSGERLAGTWTAEQVRE
ncbi:MAG TPA: hypothetical protein PK413_10515 [Thermoanaerobaculia bacterium]|nr:hypothetical protein [Thermoanaerobaculia bacterium]